MIKLYLIFILCFLPFNLTQDMEKMCYVCYELKWWGDSGDPLSYILYDQKCLHEMWFKNFCMRHEKEKHEIQCDGCIQTERLVEQYYQIDKFTNEKEETTYYFNILKGINSPFADEIDAFTKIEINWLNSTRIITDEEPCKIVSSLNLTECKMVSEKDYAWTSLNLPFKMTRDYKIDKRKNQTWIDRFEFCNLTEYTEFVQNISNKIGYIKDQKFTSDCNFDYNNYENFNQNDIPKCLQEIPFYFVLNFLNTKIVQLPRENNNIIECHEEEIKKVLEHEFRQYSKKVNSLFSKNIITQSIENQVAFVKSLVVLNSNLNKFNIAKFLINIKKDFLNLSSNLSQNMLNLFFDMFPRGYSRLENDVDFKLYQSYFNIPNRALFYQLFLYSVNFLDKNDLIYGQFSFDWERTQIEGVIEVDSQKFIYAYVDPRLFDRIYYYNKPEELTSLTDLGIQNILSIKSLENNYVKRKVFWDYCIKEEVEQNSCDYYEKCLDKKMKCDINNGYPNAFATFYCKNYETAIKNRQGQEDFEILNKWVTDVKICLKRAINDELDFITNISYSEIFNTYKKSCDTIKKKAFDSHPYCYTNSGICNLIKDHKMSFLSLMKDVFLNMRTAKNIMDDWKLWWNQIQEVIKSCYGKEIEKFAEIASEIEKWDTGLMFLSE